jgi:hypothetical protein
LAGAQVHGLLAECSLYWVALLVLGCTAAAPLLLLQWLVAKGLADADVAKFKDQLYQMWWVQGADVVFGPRPLHKSQVVEPNVLNFTSSPSLLARTPSQVLFVPAGAAERFMRL